MKLYLTVFLHALVGLRSTVSQFLTADIGADHNCDMIEELANHWYESETDAYYLAISLESVNMIMDRMEQTDVDDAFLHALVEKDCKEYLNGGTSDDDFKLSSTQLTDQDCGLLKIYADTWIACEYNFIDLTTAIEDVCDLMRRMEPDKVDYGIKIASSTECYSEASNGGTSPDEHSPAPSFTPPSNIILQQAPLPPLQLTDDMDCNNMFGAYADEWIASGNGAYETAISLEIVDMLEDKLVFQSTSFYHCSEPLFSKVNRICWFISEWNLRFPGEVNYVIEIASSTKCYSEASNGGTSPDEHSPAPSLKPTSNIIPGQATPPPLQLTDDMAPPPPDDIALEVTPPTDPPKLSSF